MVSEGQVREFLLPEPEFVRLEDARVATYRLGRSHGGPVVVFCHGTPWSARVWRDVADAVAADQAVLLWDMPGYGRSEQGPHLQLDLATQMARFAALLRQFEIDRPQVIAHDIGGAVSLGAHLLHGVDYTALQLWDVVTLDPWGSPFFRLVADHAEVFGALPPALHEALVREYIRGAACLPLTDDDLADLVAPWLGEQGQPGFYQQIAALRAEHTRPLVHRLAQVRCPCRDRVGRSRSVDSGGAGRKAAPGIAGRSVHDGDPDRRPPRPVGTTWRGHGSGAGLAAGLNPRLIVPGARRGSCGPRPWVGQV